MARGCVGEGGKQKRRGGYPRRETEPETGAKPLLDGYGCDGLEHAARDLVGIALGVWTPVFEVALVAVVHEAVWDANGRAAIGDSVAEFVDGLRLVEAGEAEMVIGAVHSDVFVFVFVERGHEGFEVFFATDFAEVLGGEVAVHPGAVPVDVFAEGFAVEVHIDPVFFAKADEQVARDPDLVCAGSGTFAEDLELPLAFCHFGVDTFVVDAGVEAQIEMFFDDFAGDFAYVFVAHARVVFTLGVGVTTALWEPEGYAVAVEEVFLLKAEPRVGVIDDGCARVAGVRGFAVWHHDFAHHEHAIAAGGVWVACNGFQHAIAASSFGLTGGASVESPHGQLLELGKAFEILDLRLATEVRDGGIAVQPDILEFIFSHEC